jgi:hypothetical protein
MIQEPSAEAWSLWARNPETLYFLQWLKQRDAELCSKAKTAAKLKQSTDEFLLRAAVFEELATYISEKR